MKTTSQKGSQKSKSKPRSPMAKKPPAKQTQTVEALRRELAEALEQQKATGEILPMIAPSCLTFTVVNTICRQRARQR
jgi:hypothetical protein